MKTILLGIILGFISVLMSCDDETILIPSDDSGNVVGNYMLPQGNNEYDTRIMEYFEKYNTVILYKFDEKEFWWNIVYDARWSYDSVANRTNAGYEINKADTLYVGEQLTLIQDKFFTYFPVTFLKEYLPLKILLVGELNYVGNVRRFPTEADWTEQSVFSGYDYLCVNWGNKKVKNMTPIQRNQFKNDMCYTFVKRLLDADKMTYSMEFVGLSNYSQSLTESNKYQYGFLQTRVSMDSDWLDYIRMCIENSYEQLIAEGGYLHAGIDTKGLIRKKYDILIAYFKTNYGIDLQAIGDDVEE